MMIHKGSTKNLAIGFALISSLIIGTGCNKQSFSLQSGSAVFAQKASYVSKADILWVVDNSGSMGPRQAGLTAQVGTFIDKLKQTDLDYQMAVTTMDMSSQGAEGHFISQAGTPSILNAQTPNLLSLIQGRIAPGSDGSLSERGMDAAKAALSANFSTNTGFLRPDAILVVIFITDEDDSSTGSATASVSDDVKWFDSVHPALPLGDRSWVVQFMGVTPTDPNCKTSAWGYNSPGLRYINLANASGGAAESICDGDFGRALTNVHARLTELLVTFPLERLPNVDSIQVLVDRIRVPKSDTNGWSYDSVSNSIHFHGAAVPGPASSIQVDFKPAGLK